MATGKPLLGVTPKTRNRVWYWNGEDPLEETERRTGAPLAEIAEECGISVSTARSQLASIFVKTRTRRQGEPVALLARVDPAVT